MPTVWALTAAAVPREHRGPGTRGIVGQSLELCRAQPDQLCRGQHGTRTHTGGLSRGRGGGGCWRPGRPAAHGVLRCCSLSPHTVPRFTLDLGSGLEGSRPAPRGVQGDSPERDPLRDPPRGPPRPVPGGGPSPAPGGLPEAWGSLTPPGSPRPGERSEVAIPPRRAADGILLSATVSKSRRSMWTQKSLASPKPWCSAAGACSHAEVGGWSQAAVGPFRRHKGYQDAAVPSAPCRPPSLLPWVPVSSSKNEVECEVWSRNAPGGDKDLVSL